MRHDRLLSLTSMQLEMAFEKHFPELKHMAVSSADLPSFEAAFSAWVATKDDGDAKDLFLSSAAFPGTSTRLFRRRRSEALPSVGLLDLTRISSASGRRTASV